MRHCRTYNTILLDILVGHKILSAACAPCAAPCLRLWLQGVKLNSLSNYINFIFVTILFHILWHNHSLNRCLKCGNKRSYTEVQISGSFYTYMQIFSAKSLKLRSGHRLRRKNNKGSDFNTGPLY